MSTLSSENIDRILSYLPYFEDEQAEKFKMSDTSVIGPYVYDDKVVQFLKELYEEDIVLDFDWAGWRDEAATYFKDIDLIREANLETVRKLFTTIVRVERLVNGLVAEMIRTGVITDLLQRLQEVRSEAGH
ncbi:MAG: hypothetical protein KGZ63_00490 [Clostridiales bacterium]|jgi:hypothetical protein|nr:hypothetical protein [Clostridiales bacterium]